MKLCLVGYTYRGCPVAHAMQRAREFGYQEIELRDFSDVDLSSLAGVRAALEHTTRLSQEHGITIRSLFYAPLPVPRDSKPSAEETAFGEVLAALADFQVPVLHTRLSLRGEDGRETVSAIAEEADYIAAVEALNRIAPVAERHSVCVAVETHMGTLHDTAAAQLRIISACPSPCICASLDFANMRITNPAERLVEAIHAFGPRIGYVHLKNVKLLPGGYDWNLPLRWGDIDYAQVLPALRETGYEGPLAVEYCGTGDPDVFAADDAAYLKELLERLNGV
jgi:sugar phosphate isomerase/epimerase